MRAGTHELGAPGRCACVPAAMLLALLSLPTHLCAFEPLPLPEGYVNAHAEAVSPDGTAVVGGVENSAGDYRAVLWVDGTVTVIEPPGPQPDGWSFSAAYGVSDAPYVVVGSATSSAGDQAFRWTDADGMQFLPTAGGGAAPEESRATAVSKDGSVVTGFLFTGGQDGLRGFRWDAPSGTLATLPPVEPWPDDLGSFSWPLDCSADGNTIVGWSSSLRHAGGLPDACRWRLDPNTGAVTTERLAPQSGTQWPNGIATGVRPDGEEAVGCATDANGYPSAVLWWEAGAIDALGSAPDSASAAQAISGDREFAVGSSDFQSGSSRPTLWHAGELTTPRFDLQEVLENDYGYDLSGWTLTSADDISCDGTTVVGSGVDANGVRRAWRARLVDVYAESVDGSPIPDVDKPTRPPGSPADESCWQATAACMLAAAGWGKAGNTPQQNAVEIYTRLTAALGWGSSGKIQDALVWWLVQYGRNPDQGDYYNSTNDHLDITCIEPITGTGGGLSPGTYEFLLDELERGHFVGVGISHPQGTKAHAMVLSGGNRPANPDPVSYWTDSDEDAYCTDADALRNTFPGGTRWRVDVGIPWPANGYAILGRSGFLRCPAGLAEYYDVANYLPPNGLVTRQRVAGAMGAEFDAPVWVGDDLLIGLDGAGGAGWHEVCLVIDYMDRGHAAFDPGILLDPGDGQPLPPTGVGYSLDLGQVLYKWNLAFIPTGETLLFPDASYRDLDGDLLTWELALRSMPQQHPPQKVLIEEAFAPGQDVEADCGFCVSAQASGTAAIVTDPLDPSNAVLSLSDGIGAPVSVSMDIDVLYDLNVSFDYRFLTEGKLHLLLDDSVLDIVLSPLPGAGFDTWASYAGSFPTTPGTRTFELRLSALDDPEIHIDNLRVTTTIPEPVSALAVMLGAGALGGYLRRRRAGC